MGSGGAFENVEFRALQEKAGRIRSGRSLPEESRAFSMAGSYPLRGGDLGCLHRFGRRWDDRTIGL